MKFRGFTLIELLVVIAIIAILAAILFPVFAQAKVDAKKSVAISNQKQISTGILLYMGDYDDLYPRNDECVRFSSLNPALNTAAKNPAANPFAGCTGPYYNRMNHFAWQKWVLPYIKNVDIFNHPLREKDPTEWNNNGQLVGSFALNLGFTGALDSWRRPATFARQRRTSWLGGNQNAIPDPSAAAILLEMPGATVAPVPSLSNDSLPATPEITVYPVAVREFWRYKLLKGTINDCVNGTSGREPDPTKVAAGGIVIGHADGSAKFYPALKFLALTPTKAEFFNGTDWSFGDDCSTPPGNLGATVINLNLNYPMWGLQKL